MSNNIRDAVASDFAELAKLSMRFYREAHQKILTVDHDKMAGFIWNIIHDEQTVLRICEDNGKMCGLYCFEIDSPWCNEQLGYVYSFYVLPEFRNGRVGLSLAKDLARQQEEREVKIMYATNTAGIGRANYTAFKRLFERVGFDDNIGCLTRII